MLCYAILCYAIPPRRQGFSGADLASLVREAAMLAIRAADIPEEVPRQKPTSIVSSQKYKQNSVVSNQK